METRAGLANKFPRFCDLYGVFGLPRQLELLSVRSALTRGALAGVWLSASILVWSFAICVAKNRSFSATFPPFNPATATKPLSTADWLLLAGLRAVVFLLGVVAFVAPPNT